MIATESQIILALLLPLAAAVVGYVGFSGRKEHHAVCGWLASAGVCASFLLFVSLFYQLRLGLAQSVDAALFASLGSWLEAGQMRVSFNLRIDGLSGVMCLLVTGVGFLIHVYAVSYMAADQERPRFFAYMSLFIFAMLLLVLADSLPLMFAGWEGVGLCSYLLIGFWHREMPNAQAGQKAFIVNRVGDAGFIVGMLVLFLATGKVNFVDLQSVINTVSPSTVQLIALALFVGAVGKSAQLPLFVWLPDAMAGPTPVSALIHAATMVTAGVYLVCRMSFLFVLAPQVLAVMAVVGVLTAFIAATIALTQFDIKKVLAYSTISQLGFMFMALGVGAFSNGIYHVVTHAFFKACLFMCAGSVIVACHHEQDMRYMGGLWRRMPYTSACYLICVLSIAGLPYSSGYYSKDAILWTVYSAEGLFKSVSIGGYPLGRIIYCLGLVTAFVTAIYMARSVVMTFVGTLNRYREVKEYSWVLRGPVVILACLAWGFASYYGDALLELLHSWTRLDMQLSQQLLEDNPEYHRLELMSSLVAVVGLTIGGVCYGLYPQLAARLAPLLSWPRTLLQRQYYLDELYAGGIVAPLQYTAGAFYRVLDRGAIEGVVNGVGQVFLLLAQGLRQTQSRVLSVNLFSLAGFILVLLLLFLW